MRVAPLFETLDDLDHSESAMEQLLGNPWYAAHIKGEQECMIGYSDSGKDAGRMAAAWGLYKVQARPLQQLRLCHCQRSCPHALCMAAACSFAGSCQASCWPSACFQSGDPYSHGAHSCQELS